MTEHTGPILGTAKNWLGRDKKIVLTENKAMQPVFTTSETPFQIFTARSGQPYKLTFMKGDAPVEVMITCTLVRL